MNIRLEGVATKDELKQLAALEGFANTLRALKCTEAQKIIDDIVREAKAALSALPEVYEEETITLNDPADTANMFRSMYGSQRKTITVRNCKIGRGKVFGSYRIYKGSRLATPKKSFPAGAKREYLNLLQNNKITATGEVLVDIDLNSRNIVASLATGTAVNANRVLSGL